MYFLSFFRVASGMLSYRRNTCSYMYMYFRYLLSLSTCYCTYYSYKLSVKIIILFTFLFSNLVICDHVLHEGWVSQQLFGTWPVWTHWKQYTDTLHHCGYKLGRLSEHTNLRYVTFVKRIKRLWGERGGKERREEERERKKRLIEVSYPSVVLQCWQLAVQAMLDPNLSEHQKQ